MVMSERPSATRSTTVEAPITHTLFGALISTSWLIQNSALLPFSYPSRDQRLVAQTRDTSTPFTQILVTFPLYFTDTFYISLCARYNIGAYIIPLIIIK